MSYTETIGSRTYRFADLKTLLAKASPQRSGDQLAGVAAASEEERVAARMALAQVPPKADVAPAPETPVKGTRGGLPAVGDVAGLAFGDRGQFVGDAGKRRYHHQHAPAHADLQAGRELRSGVAAAVPEDGQCVE